MYYGRYSGKAAEAAVGSELTGSLELEDTGPHETLQAGDLQNLCLLGQGKRGSGREFSQPTWTPGRSGLRRWC
jgi:hypothetical protein